MVARPNHYNIGSAVVARPRGYKKSPGKRSGAEFGGGESLYAETKRPAVVPALSVSI